MPKPLAPALTNLSSPHRAWVTLILARLTSAKQQHRRPRQMLTVFIDSRLPHTASVRQWQFGCHNRHLLL